MEVNSQGSVGSPVSERDAVVRTVAATFDGTSGTPPGSVPPLAADTIRRNGVDPGEAGDQPLGERVSIARQGMGAIRATGGRRSGDGHPTRFVTTSVCDGREASTTTAGGAIFRPLAEGCVTVALAPRLAARTTLGSDEREEFREPS